MENNTKNINEILTEIYETKSYIDDKFETIKENINKLSINQNTEEEAFPSGNIKALKIFNNINHFFNFAENLYNVNAWEIRDDTYLERAKKLKHYPYWQTLKDLFNQQNLTKKNLGDEQLVTFFDTMSIMYRTFKKIDNNDFLNEIKIIMEYVIPIASKNRADYILCYRNSLLIIEFSKADNMNKIGSISSNKSKEVAQYKEQMISSIDLENIKIYCHACVYLHETYKNTQAINEVKIDDLLEVINRNFIKSKTSFEILKDNQ